MLSWLFQETPKKDPPTWAEIETRLLKRIDVALMEEMVPLPLQYLVIAAGIAHDKAKSERLR